jgi:enterochelin esterase-like enzyme
MKALLSLIPLLLVTDRLGAAEAPVTISIPAPIRSTVPYLRTPGEYPANPDASYHEGVPRGRIEEHAWNDSKLFPGTTRKFWVYVPAQYDPSAPAAVMVFQDGGGTYLRPDRFFHVPAVFDNLIARGEMPVTIAILIDPGQRPPNSEDGIGAPPNPNLPLNRRFEYDSLTDTYARFLIEEILPEVAKHYHLTDNPDERAICGNSSGGICAFTVAWQRPDAFRKVVSHVGSFVNLRGGHVYPDLVRAAPRKPLRVFLESGVNDLENEYGQWWPANKAMAAALADQGYDLKTVWGDGGHNPRHGGSIFSDTLRWLWRDHPRVRAAAP